MQIENLEDDSEFSETSIDEDLSSLDFERDLYLSYNEKFKTKINDLKLIN